VTTIERGSNIDLRSCDADWCTVHFGRYADFVNASDLDFGAPRGSRAPLLDLERGGP